MRNMGMVKEQETIKGRLCEHDAVACLVMVVSTWALLGRVWFQSHTSSGYIVAKLMTLLPSVSHMYSLLTRSPWGSYSTSWC